MNSSQGTGNFTRDESSPPPRTLMIKQDSVGRKHSVGFPVIYRHPMAVNFSRPVRAARMKRSIFLLRRRRGTKHFGRTCLVETAVNSALPHGFEDSRSTQTGDISREFRCVEAHTHVTLCSQVVDF